MSLLYDRVDGRPLLLRCRYLGRDYSGRYGNFFAHAVVAEPDELEGLRPAELWHAAHWTPMPAPGAVLEPLDELNPGAALDPEALAAWLAVSGPDDPYALLAQLVDAVAEVLGRGHGRVVLVADDVELIARWIAVVSYSLPVAAAARLSFVTYTADPDSAAQRLVGTTPAIWAAAQHHASHASAFDLHKGGADGRASRFARTVADCWRAADFGGLDALGELAPLNDPAQEGPPRCWRCAGATRPSRPRRRARRRNCWRGTARDPRMGVARPRARRPVHGARPRARRARAGTLRGAGRGAGRGHRRPLPGGRPCSRQPTAICCTSTPSGCGPCPTSPSRC